MELNNKNKSFKDSIGNLTFKGSYNNYYLTRELFPEYSGSFIIEVLQEDCNNLVLLYKQYSDIIELEVVLDVLKHKEVLVRETIPFGNERVIYPYQKCIGAIKKDCI